MDAIDDNSASAGRGNLLVWGAVSVVLGCSVAGGVGFMAPLFADLYAGFGPSLPLTARIVLGWWFLLFALPAVSLVVTFLGWRRRSAADARRALGLVHVLSAIAAILGALAMIALYLPIFTMGEPV